MPGLDPRAALSPPPPPPPPSPLPAFIYFLVNARRLLNSF
jgi:hypothetical protein